jgi:hypothetical protein
VRKKLRKMNAHRTDKSYEQKVAVLYSARSTGRLHCGRTHSAGRREGAKGRLQLALVGLWPRLT